MLTSISLRRINPVGRTLETLVGCLTLVLCLPLAATGQIATEAMPKTLEKAAPQEAEAQDDDEEGFETIFNGENLEGWTGNPDLWTVEEGAITGTTTKEAPLKFNQFITWDNEVADFELRCMFKIESGNSGIQFRSKVFGEPGTHRIAGYQADIDPSMRYMGILFEERGRKILAQRGTTVEIDAEGKKNVTGRTGEEADIVAAIDATGWNEYVIRAVGNRITQSINGQVTVELVDNHVEGRAASGLLSLQIHQGPPMRVQFKKIRIKDLSEDHGEADQGEAGHAEAGQSDKR